MFQTRKDIEEIKKNISELNIKTKESNELVINSTNEIKILKNDLNELRKLQNEFLSNFKNNLNEIKDIKEDLKKELYDFKLLKSQMQKQILAKFEEELKKELDLKFNELKTTADNYDNLRKEIMTISKSIISLNTEINKFNEIAKNIKKEDFELDKFAKHLLAMDNDKLELMKKIDTLERLIARMRRTK